MEGVVLVNKAAGPDDDAGTELRRAMPGVEIRPCPPEAMAEAVGSLVASGAAWVGVAGGDGTIRSAAQHLVGTGVALLTVPAGTRNHFARQLGITNAATAAQAATGRTRAVDVGDVNGHVFVNNSSIGIYPLLVANRERRYHHLPKLVGSTMALVGELRSGRAQRVCVDGDDAVPTWMTFVGNNRYCRGLFDATEREHLDEGLLDVRLVHADRVASRWRIVSAALLGRLDRSPVVTTAAARACVIEPDEQAVDVALDGEVVRLETPLRYRSRPGALLVRVPPPDDSTGGATG